MTLKCPDCGSTEIDSSQARGDASCVDCGKVLEQNVIVNEVGFSEDARGRSNMVGQHVHADGRANSFSVLPGFSRQATEVTMQNGRRRLSHLVSALKLSNRHTESAIRLFRLAVERNFHKGRRMANICCACLYVVCRIEKTPHMLLDFADVLETNVYVLGHTFLKFAQLLSLQLPIIDPSLYIHRFASKLEFGESTHAVAMSALRLLARMRRDWMSYGRRPSGLCGAALIIAARMHNFYRSQTDVVRVVRIGNVALRERLQELDRTPTAALTPAQIDAGGGDDGNEASLNADPAAACDPPAFRKLQRSKSLIGGKHASVGEGQPLAEKAADDSTAKPVASATQPSGELTNGIRIAPAKTGRTAADAELEGELEAALASDELQELERESTVEEELRKNAAEQEVLKRKRQLQGDAAQDVEAEKDTNDDGDLSDLDDEDAAKYLNTEEEYERKKELWTEINKEYLENQERLEKMKRERPEEYERLRPWGSAAKKRKASGAPKSAKNNSRTASAAKPPVPKSSKKLNYSVLKTLGRTGTLGAAGVGAAVAHRPPAL